MVVQARALKLGHGSRVVSSNAKVSASTSHVVKCCVRQMRHGTRGVTFKRFARAAVRDGANNAQLKKFAQTSRTQPSHAERDTVRMLLPRSGWQPYFLRLKLSKNTEVVECSHPVIPLHELFSILWEKPKQRELSLLGPEGERGPGNFWKEALLRTAWARMHPANAHGRLDKCIPLLVHHDGVHHSQVFSWCSQLSKSVNVFDQCFMAAHFQDDEMTDVLQSTHREVARFYAWSFECLLQGRFPETGMYGEKLEGWRSERAGSELAGGWTAAFVGICVDGKAAGETHGWGAFWSSYFLCDECFASNWPRWPNAPKHLSYLDHQGEWKHTIRLDWPDSPWLQVPGFSRDLQCKDIMHNCHIGFGRDVVASTVRHWDESGLLAIWSQRIAGEEPPRRKLWYRCLEFCKEHNVSLPRKFDCFSKRGLGETKSVPSATLHSNIKASHVGILLLFLGHIACEIPATDASDVAAGIVVHSLATFLHTLSNAPLWLDEETAQRAQTLGMLFLKNLHFLHKHHTGYPWAMLRPKVHWFSHTVVRIGRDRFNPLRWSVFAFEDFMGKIKRMSQYSHGTTMSARTVERYMIFVYERLSRRASNDART